MLQDLQALSDLVNSAYRGESSEKGWTTEASLLGGQRTDPLTLQESLLDPQAVILVYELEGVLQGCVLLRQETGYGYLGMLTIRPDLQAGGLGKKLISYAENYVQEKWKLKKIQMTVIKQRVELIAWYERRGYKDTGRREAFPYGDPKFGLPKRDDLEFVVLDKEL